MNKQIKKLYAEYKQASKNCDRVLENGTEEQFDAALDVECEKLDELVIALSAFTMGRISDYELRCMATSTRYADRFESLIERLAA